MCVTVVAMAKTNRFFSLMRSSQSSFTLRKVLSPNGTFLVDFTALWYYIVFACQICFCPSGYTLSEEEWTKKFHFFIMILLHLFFASSGPSNARFIQKGAFQFGNILQIYSIVFPKILILMTTTCQVRHLIFFSRNTII